MADNNTSPEIIFAITQDGVRTQTYGGVTLLVHASVGGSMNARNYGIDGGWYGLGLKPEAYALFGRGDGRTSTFYTTGRSVVVATIASFHRGTASTTFTNGTALGVSG